MQSEIEQVWCFTTLSPSIRPSNGATLNAKSVIWCAFLWLCSWEIFNTLVRLCFPVGSPVCSSSRLSFVAKVDFLCLQLFTALQQSGHEYRQLANGHLVVVVLPKTPVLGQANPFLVRVLIWRMAKNSLAQLPPRCWQKRDAAQFCNVLFLGVKRCCSEFVAQGVLLLLATSAKGPVHFKLLCKKLQLSSFLSALAAVPSNSPLFAICWTRRTRHPSRVCVCRLCVEHRFCDSREWRRVCVRRRNKTK